LLATTFVRAPRSKGLSRQRLCRTFGGDAENDERQEQDPATDGAESKVPQTSRPDTTPDGHLHYHPDEAAEYGVKPDEIRELDDEGRASAPEIADLQARIGSERGRG
jgi:hypothetical protein